MDLVIKNGTLITPDGPFKADVGIEGERIAAIGEGLTAPNVLDAAGKYVLPGAIDVHVHMQMPVGDVVSSDDFYTGTVAAACGGTTTIIDFVEPKGLQSLMDALHQRRAEADGRVAVDYGLHMTLNSDDPLRLAEIPAVMDAGCTTFKLYMAYEGLRLSDGAMLRALAALQKHRGLPIVHAENHDVVQYLTEKFLREGKTAPRYHPLTRPDFMEGEATARALALARVVGLPMYIVHVSCAEALGAVRTARAKGQPAYGETCPQYLLLTRKEYERPGFEGAKFVMSPPLRDEADVSRLWDALASGDLQVVATDHCPFFYEGQKDKGRAAFNKIPGGAPGVETRLPLLYTFGVRAERLSLGQWVRVCCEEPARLFGLAPRKGRIAEGADADLVIFNPKRHVVLHSQILHQNVDYTPYEGLELVGYPETTLLRGQVIVRDGEFVGHAGQGRFIRRHVSGAWG
ncbi:MAG: dihydropyrimidinase [Anaerolineales bacterium]